MAEVSNSAETSPKISTGWVGCTSVTDRQTDGRATAYTEREREFTFAKNGGRRKERRVRNTAITTAAVLHWPVLRFLLSRHSRWHATRIFARRSFERTSASFGRRDRRWLSARMIRRRRLETISRIRRETHACWRVNRIYSSRRHAGRCLPLTVGAKFFADVLVLQLDQFPVLV